ncbi:MAG: IclR family transcriptional regulator [Anaerolineales bacterium]|nr:MAG: IclR family transcriptional regulator [Anaerolineales bacterium]
MPQAVRAVERALDILLCFRTDRSSLSLTEIAEQVGMNKSTIHRLLATLESKHFIIRDKATGMYQLGYLFVELASIILQDLDLRQLAKPYLQQLSDRSGETVDLAILSDGHVVYLQVIESTQRVKIAAAVGERLPATCTATGKAFLAYLPESQVRQILDQDSTRYTERTLTSLEKLLANLRETRTRGFSISEQEYEIEINAVAAPIMDANGSPVAVIAIVGPSYRMPPERLQSLGQLLKETTDALSREVGQATLPTILSNINYSSTNVNNL